MKEKTDIQVSALIELVGIKKGEIKKAEKPDWKTNCLYRGAKADVNIRTIGNVEDLVYLLATIKLEASYIQEAARELGVKNFNEKISGFTLKDWTADLKTRANKITISKKKEDLEKLEAKLDKLISPELKRQMEIEAIKKELEESD